MEVFQMSTTFWIQLIGIIFGIAMMYFSFIKYKKKEISKSEFYFWQLGWIGLILVAFVPNIFDPIIGKLNFYRRLDFFVVVGFFALLGLGFYNYSIMRGMEKKMEKFVRRQAMRDVQKPKPPHEEK
jgi:hypothetical protein